MGGETDAPASSLARFHRAGYCSYKKYSGHSRMTGLYEQ